jgi:folate-dependent phosphoribosylglycinamide formyltransferase PurN
LQNGIVAAQGAVQHGDPFVVLRVHVGPILAQAAVPVLPDDTEESLSERILKEEHRLLPEVLREWSDRNER